MIEKRYYAHKHLLHENEVHDKRCHNFMGLDETVEHMNNEYWKYKQLKNENEQLKSEIKYLNDILARNEDEYVERNEDEYVEEDIGYYMTKGRGFE